jgi:MFS family permease
MVGYVIDLWCAENKGTIMGAVLAANGLGGALSAQIVSPIIESSYGYRAAYFLIAGIFLVIGTLVVLLVREPREGEEEAGDAVPKKRRGESWIGVGNEVVLKKVYCWGALFCIFMFGLTLNGIAGISAAHMRDVGLDAPFIATMSSITFMTLTASKFVAGISYDRIGLRKTITVSCLAAIGCMLALSFTSPTAAGKGLACAYAVMSAIAFPLETVMIPLYALDLYGEHSYDKILGIFVSANTAGYAIGIPFSNIGYDLTGSYNSVLRVDAMIMLCVVLTMQWVITSTHRMREKCQ